MPENPTTPRRRDAEATRAALLEAARALLAERGATKTTTRDIAAAVGVNQALVNRYFGSKENLFVEAARSDESRVAAAIESGPLHEIPDRVLRAVLEVSVSGRGTTALLAGVVNDAAITEVIREQVTSTFTEGLGGRLGEPDGALRAELLNALVVGITVMRHKIGSQALVKANDDEISRYVTAMAIAIFSDEAVSPSASSTDKDCRR